MKPQLTRIIPTLLLVFGLNMTTMNSVLAHDEKGSFFSQMGASCGQLTEDLKKGEPMETMYKMYLDGFIDSINATIPGNFNFFSGTDRVSRFKFVVKYCEENPLSAMYGGINELVKKITKKDLQQLVPPQSVKNSKHVM